jgi:hypothetical protein
MLWKAVFEKPTTTGREEGTTPIRSSFAQGLWKAKVDGKRAAHSGVAEAMEKVTMGHGMRTKGCAAGSIHLRNSNESSQQED